MPLPEAITVNLADDEILERLFKLNQQRAAAGPTPDPAKPPAVADAHASLGRPVPQDLPPPAGVAGTESHGPMDHPKRSLTGQG
jgi:hypothetical protein